MNLFDRLESIISCLIFIFNILINHLIIHIIYNYVIKIINIESRDLKLRC